jgi:hypothetical protein
MTSDGSLRHHRSCEWKYQSWNWVSTILYSHARWSEEVSVAERRRARQSLKIENRDCRGQFRLMWLMKKSCVGKNPVSSWLETAEKLQIRENLFSGFHLPRRISTPGPKPSERFPQPKNLCRRPWEWPQNVRTAISSHWILLIHGIWMSKLSPESGQRSQRNVTCK